MAAPTFQAAGVAQETQDNAIVPWPSHQADDVAFLIIESVAGQAANLAVANGFAAVTNSPVTANTGTAGCRLTLYWCRATSSSMASPEVTDPGNHVYAQIVTFRGVKTSGDPWNATSNANNASASTTATWSSVTTTVDNCLIAFFGARDTDSAAAHFSGFAGGTGLTSHAEAAGTDAGTILGNGGGIVLNTAVMATAGATGNPTATVTSAIIATITVALEPANNPPTISPNTADANNFGSDTTPTLEFTGTDPNSDSVRYNILISNNSAFTETNTYYFDASDAGPTDTDAVWSNDANAFDGSTATSASVSTTGSTASNFLLGEGTTAPTSGGTITQVRARLYGSGNGDGGTARGAIYTNSLGELLGTPAGVSGGANYGSYVTLSTPTGGWTWQKVNDLEVKLYSPNTPASATVRRVEVEVTSNPSVYLDKVSGTDSGFANTVTGGDTDPFNSGEKVSYTVQGGDALSTGTYYWKARAIDPSGTNTYSSFTTTRSFDIDTSGDGTAVKDSISMGFIVFSR